MNELIESLLHAGKHHLANVCAILQCMHVTTVALLQNVDEASILGVGVTTLGFWNGGRRGLTSRRDLKRNLKLT